MTDDKTIDSNIKHLILEVSENMQPKATEQLISLMKARYSILPEKSRILLLDLESEGHIRFRRLQQSKLPSKFTMGSQKVFWYWTMIILSAVTAITVFAIPESDYPLIYLRVGLGLLFVFFFPGYAFVKLLFPVQLPKNITLLSKGQIEGKGVKRMEIIERVALSIGLSLVNVPLVGLILSYSPAGIRLVPVTLSLLALTVVLSTLALYRQYKITSYSEN